MEVAHSRYIKKKKRITLNGVFYAIISSCSFGFSPLFSLGLLAAGLSNFDVLSYRKVIFELEHQLTSIALKLFPALL